MFEETGRPGLVGRDAVSRDNEWVVVFMCGGAPRRGIIPNPLEQSVDAGREKRGRYPV